MPAEQPVPSARDVPEAMEVFVAALDLFTGDGTMSKATGELTVGVHLRKTETLAIRPAVSGPSCCGWCTSARSGAATTAAPYLRQRPSERLGRSPPATPRSSCGGRGSRSRRPPAIRAARSPVAADAAEGAPPYSPSDQAPRPRATRPRAAIVPTRPSSASRTHPPVLRRPAMPRCRPPRRGRAGRPPRAPPAPPRRGRPPARGRPNVPAARLPAASAADGGWRLP